MIITNFQYFLIFLSSYVLVGVLTPLMRNIAISREILDIPNSAHKSHSQPIPYLGGVAIIVGVVIVTYIPLFLYNFSVANLLLATSVLGPAIAMGVIGLWDDIKQLLPLPRFVAQTIAGVIVSILLILNNGLGNPTGSKLLDALISVIWIVGICNSINFFDNLDGGAAGTSAITAIALTYLAINNNQSYIAALSLTVTGATLGFLIWNRSPARIYMGDSGALFLGLLLSILTIRLRPGSSSPIESFAIPILLLAVPILDTTVAVTSRLRRRVSPFQGGKDHLSHRLIRSGLSRKSSAITLWLLSVFFALFSIIISSDFLNMGTNFVFGLAVIWILLLVGFLRTKDE